MNTERKDPPLASESLPISLLLIDDDVELCSMAMAYFRQHGFRVECAHDGNSALAKSLESSYDLIILDVMLPLRDGFEVLRQIRKRSTIPVIMLTARAAPQDRIGGLNAGADDYLPKPFAPEELLARIRAVLRRGRINYRHPEMIEVGDVRLDIRTREVRCLKQRIEMTSIEFEILQTLMRSPGRVVSRDELSMMIYKRPSTPYERSLDVHICHVRKKLEDSGSLQIKAVRGIGYLLSPIAGGEQ